MLVAPHVGSTLISFFCSEIDILLFHAYTQLLKLADVEAFPNVTVTTNAQTGDGPLGSHTYGFARLIVPGDQAMGRFISNLTELQVVDLSS